LRQNQLVSNMDVITIESKAYKEIVAKIDVIANYDRIRQEVQQIIKDELERIGGT